MKLVFGIAIVVLVALSIVADYKWKQWMAARRRDAEAQNPHSDRRS